MSGLIMHTDPGHGWLEVSIEVLIELGLMDKISGYSYVSADRKTAYLEEDCDMASYVVAYEAKHGARPKYDERNTNGDSFVRRLRSFTSVYPRLAARGGR